MFLAIREMRRSIGRYALLMASVGLLVFLILFQQTLQDGLITSFVGAIRNQSAPVLVYSVDGRRTLQGSVIPPNMESTIRGVRGVGDAGRIGVGTYSVTAAGKLTTASLIGYEKQNLGAPSRLTAGRYPKTDGEAVALDTKASGFGIGDEVVVRPGGLVVRIVGRASDVGLQATPTLFATYATFERAVVAGNPDALGALPSVIAISGSPGVNARELAARVNAASNDVDALTRSDAAAKTPGVAQIQQSFNIIFLLYGLVIPLVTGLFFLIITLQKSSALTLLRAIGVHGATLVRSLLFQVSIVLIVGIGFGTLLYLPISSQRLGEIQLSFQASSVVFWSVLLMVLGLLSSLFSALRVLRIDPIEASTGAGAGR